MSPISIGGSDDVWTAVTTSNITNFDWKIGDKITSAYISHTTNDSNSYSNNRTVTISGFSGILIYKTEKMLLFRGEGYGSGYPSNSSVSGTVFQLMIPLATTYGGDDADMGSAYDRWTTRVFYYYTTGSSSSLSLTFANGPITKRYNWGPQLNGVHTTATPLS